MRRRRIAQSTVEYTLLLAALVLAFIYAAGQVIKPKAKSLADKGGQIIDKAGNEIGAKIGVNQ